MTKGVAADFALTDVGMTIDARTQVGFGIVEMKSEDLRQANGGLGFLDGFVPTLRRADVVARGKKVRGIETDPETLRLFHAIEKGGEMLQLVAEASALPS